MKQKITNKEIDDMFFNHIYNEETATKMGKVQDAGKRVAKLINKNCPDSREKSLAFTKLEEAIMWATKSLKHGE